MTESHKPYTEQLREFCVEILAHTRSRAPAGMEGLVTRMISVVETTSSKSGLQQVARDLVEGTLGLSEVEVREIDDRLASRDLPTLSSMRDSEGREFRKILLRGRIRDEDEARFVEARLSDMGPTGPSDSERALANALLLSCKL
jgi:hypothetical protein